MKRMRTLRWYFGFLAALASAQLAHAQGPQTFTVLVGAEDTSVGANVNAYFPGSLTIHAGDTVHWQGNAHEIHTVTFLAGTPLPPFLVPAPLGLPAPVMRNPKLVNPTAPTSGQYDGTTFADSGIMGPDPGQAQFFDLTFTTLGTYHYVCGVHGVKMSGKISVVDDPVEIPSPSDVDQEAKQLIAAELAQVPLAFALANVTPTPTANPDGTTTFYVLVGYTFGQLDLLQFFPDQMAVNPGDTVVWTLSDENMAPHTVTFLNGNPSPDDVVLVPQDGGLPPLQVINPAVLFPQTAGQPLSKDGIYSSGIFRPGTPVTSFSLKIGDITGDMPYQCLLHDGSGMLGSLQIVPR